MSQKSLQLSKWALCLSLLVWGVSLAHGQQPPAQDAAAPLLQLNQSVTRTLKGGETHSYRLNLAAGQFVRVTVEQRGVDVAVSLFASNGKLLAARDRCYGRHGEESLSAEVTTAGIYHVEVQSEKDAPEGQYTVNLIAQRPPTEADKKRIKAEKQFQDAENLRFGRVEEKLSTKYEETLSLWRELGDSYAEALTFVALYSLYSVLEQNDKALEAAHKALALHRARQNRQAEGDLFFRLGKWVSSESVQHAQAAQYYQDAAQALLAAGDTAGATQAFQGLAEMLTRLGAVQNWQGNQTQALEIYGRALPLFRQVGDKAGEANVLHLMGQIYQAQHDNPRAIANFRQALELFRAAKDQAGETRTTRSLGLLIPPAPQQTELVVQTGHSDNVAFVAFGPDGKILVSGSDDKTLKLWDVATGKELHTLPNKIRLNSAVFSPDGLTLANVVLDEGIRFWDIATGKELRTLKRYSSFDSVAFSPDGKTLATSGYENTVRLWDVISGTELYNLTCPNDVDHVAFNANGKTVAAWSEDGTIKVWHVATGKEVRTLAAPHEIYAPRNFSPDGNFFAYRSQDDTVVVLDIANGVEKRIVTNGPVRVITFSPDNKAFAMVGGEDSAIEIWDIATGLKLATLTGHTEQVESLAFSPDGKTVASAGSDKSIRLWDVSTGKMMQMLTSHTSPTYSPLLFSPDGQLLVSNNGYKTIKLWDIAKGKEARTLTDAWRVIFSPTDQIIAISATDKTIKLWNVLNGRELHILDNDAVSWSMAFSPDGKILASDNSHDGTVKLWEVASGRRLWTLQTPHAQTRHHFAVPVRHKQMLRTLQPPRVVRDMAVGFSPDGKTIASTGSNDTIEIWDVASGTLIETLDEEAIDKKEPATKEKVLKYFPRFYRDTDNNEATSDKLLARRGVNGKVTLYDRATKEELCSLIALDEYEWAVIDPDGRFDASEKGMKLLHFVVGLEPIDLEQIKDRYYVPGLLAKKLQRQPLAPVRPFMSNELYPAVEYEPLKPGQKSLTLGLKNRGGGIGPVQVFLNGKEFADDARPQKFNPNQPQATLNIDLSHAPFIPGAENRINIVARNGAGWMESRGSRISYQDTGPKQNDPPEFYAIVGGVSQYDAPALNLRYAAKDAQDIARALEIGASKLYGKDRVHIRLLASGADKSQPFLHGPDSRQLTPTKANFVQVFQEFTKAKPGDYFVVYLAGHGTAIKLGNGDASDTYLYLTAEAKTTDSQRLRDDKLREPTTLSSNELTLWMNDIHAGKQALILDTCAAGAAQRDLAQRTPSDEQGYQTRALNRLRDRTGFFVLMGSAANAQAYEASRYGQGLLTYAVLSALQGEGLKDEFAWVSTVFNHAVKRVPDLARNIGGIQAPHLFTPRESQDFFFGRFTLDEQKQFSVRREKPLVLLTNLLNERQKRDNLRLKPLLAMALREASSDSENGEPPLVFVDADEIADDALEVSGTYEETGETARLTLLLVKNNVTVKELSVSGSVKDGPDRAALAQATVRAIIAAAQQVFQAESNRLPEQ